MKIFPKFPEPLSAFTGPGDVGAYFPQVRVFLHSRPKLEAERGLACTSQFPHPARGIQKVSWDRLLVKLSFSRVGRALYINEYIGRVKMTPFLIEIENHGSQDFAIDSVISWFQKWLKIIFNKLKTCNLLVVMTYCTSVHALLGKETYLIWHVTAGFTLYQLTSHNHKGNLSHKIAIEVQSFWLTYYVLSLEKMNEKSYNEKIKKNVWRDLKSSVFSHFLIHAHTEFDDFVMPVVENNSISDIHDSKIVSSQIPLYLLHRTRPRSLLPKLFPALALRHELPPRVGDLAHLRAALALRGRPRARRHRWQQLHPNWLRLVSGTDLYVRSSLTGVHFFI